MVNLLRDSNHTHLYMLVKYHNAMTNCKLRLKPLKYSRNPLAAADTHGYQSIASITAMQFINSLDRQDAAGGADGMT